MRSVSIEASRGVIRDRRGELLAVSAPVVSFYVNPQRFSPAREEAAALAEALQLSPSTLGARIEEARKRGLRLSEASRVLGSGGGSTGPLGCEA